MKRLKPMEVGYNLVEENLIGEKYERIEDRMSIIEFLRRLRSNKEIKRTIAVIGFDDILFHGEDVAEYIHDILSRSASRLRNYVIQLPVQGELRLNTEPKIKHRGREISLTPVFGSRLKPIAPGYFYSPPNI